MLSGRIRISTGQVSHRENTDAYLFCILSATYEMKGVKLHPQKWRNFYFFVTRGFETKRQANAKQTPFENIPTNANANEFEKSASNANANEFEKFSNA